MYIQTRKLVNLSIIAFGITLVMFLLTGTISNAESYYNSSQQNLLIQKEEKIKEKSSHLSEEVAEEVEKEPDESLAEGIIVAPKKMVAKKVKVEVREETPFSFNGPKLTESMGLNKNGPSGEETFYNDGTQASLVARMRRLGFSAEKYPYWVRSDGVRMLGDYVMVAANLSVHPRGQILPCSLGMAIVCDTGGFAVDHPYRLDIFTTWPD